MKSIRKRLLAIQPMITTTVKILGGEYEIKLLSSARLAAHNITLQRAQEQQDGELMNKETAQLILDSLIDGDVVAADSTTVDELLTVYINKDIRAAQTAILAANFQKDDAMEAAKND